MHAPNPMLGYFHTSLPGLISNRNTLVDTDGGNDLFAVPIASLSFPACPRARLFRCAPGGALRRGTGGLRVSIRQWCVRECCDACPARGPLCTGSPYSAAGR